MFQIGDIVYYSLEKSKDGEFYYGFVSRTLKTTPTIHNIEERVFYEIVWFDGTKSSTYSANEIVKVV